MYSMEERVSGEVATHEGVGTMTDAALSEVVDRVRQAVNAAELPMSEDFSSPFVNVLVQTHPALIPLLRSRVYYRDALSMAEKWSVSAVESSHLWRSAVTLLSPVWRPVLDHGGDGYVVDVGRCTRLIMVRSTRSMIVRDRSENRVSIVGGDVLGLCAELCRVIRGIHTSLAVAAGAFPLRSSALVRDGRAICFVGDSGAGKSTALLAAATAHLDGLSIMADGKTLLYRDDGLSVLAWPSVIDVAAGSLMELGAGRVLSPDSRDRYGGMAHVRPDLPLVEALSPVEPPLVPAKVRLLPEDLRRALGMSFATEGCVVAVVESELALGEARSRLEVVTDAEERMNVLRRNVLEDWVNQPDWLGLLVSPRGKGRDKSCLEAVPDDVVVVKFRAGSDGKDVARGLVDVLTCGKSAGELAATIAAGPPPTYHFGVYARIVRDGRMLCVNKTRGPYTGLLDLPGGRPELAESWEDALRRELGEEVGVGSVAVGEFSRFSLRVDSDTAGESIDFHHHGVVADVRLLEELPRATTLSPDTAGWGWFDVLHGDRSRLSPIARSVIDQ